MKRLILTLLALLMVPSFANAQEVYGLPVPVVASEPVVVQTTFGLQLFQPVRRVAETVARPVRRVVEKVKPAPVQQAWFYPAPAQQSYIQPRFVVVPQKTWAWRMKCFGGQCRMVWTYE